MIFTVLEEDDTIRRGIWPRKGDSVSGKSKSTHYKNLAQKVRVSEPEFQPLVTKNNGKAATHFGTSNDTTQSDVMDPISSSIRCTSSPFNSSPSGAQPRRKTEVIAELSDSLRDAQKHLLELLSKSCFY